MDVELCLCLDQGLWGGSLGFHEFTVGETKAEGWQLGVEGRAGPSCGQLSRLPRTFYKKSDLLVVCGQ